MEHPISQVERPLMAQLPEQEMVEVSRGHYRIGTRQDPAAYDNEEPAQIVELSAFRIQLTPVANSAWLAFMQEGAITPGSFGATKVGSGGNRKPLIRTTGVRTDRVTGMR